MNKQRLVEDFMRATGNQHIPQAPEVPDEEMAMLRVTLIDEEFQEFVRATNARDVVGVADALGDLLYVIYGAASAWGIKIDPIFGEIHRSNMTKFIDGYERADGKWIKGPSYEPARIKEVLDNQLYDAIADANR